MFSRRFVLAAAVALAFGATAQAAVITASATAQQTVAGGAVNVPNVQLMLTTGGSSFTNQLSLGLPSNGDQARTALAAQIVGYNNTSNNFLLANFGTNKLTAVFVGTATLVNGVGGQIIGSYGPGTGVLALYATPAGTAFNRADPNTWYANAATPLATFGIVARDNIVPGTGEPYVVPSAFVNTFATNLAINNTIDGFALLGDITDPFYLVNKPADAIFEGLIGRVSETILDPANSNTPTLTPGGLTALNTLFQNFFGVNFASSLNNGADPNSFAPGSAQQPGDFTTNAALQFTGAFATQQVPEPMTMMVWGVVLGSSGLVARRRMKRAAAAA